MQKIVQKILKNIVNFVLETILPMDPLLRQVEIFGTFLLRPEPVIGEYAEAFYVCRYLNPFVRTALIEIKNHPNKKVAGIIGKLLFNALVDGISENRKTKMQVLVLPIPITAKKKRERGWNQCELVLDGFIRAMQESSVTDRELLFEPRRDILIKSRENADQVGMTRVQRFENLKNCFAVPHPELVKDRTVIVFDDILTTGATFKDARRALEQAGANKIICVAIAH